MKNRFFFPSRHILGYFLWIVLLTVGCHSSKDSSVVLAPPITTSPDVVEVRVQGEGFQLYRRGKPYFIRGASGFTHWDELAARGGNTVRTYTTHRLDGLLDQADSLQLAVIVGLELPLIRNGFDYGDKAAVDSLISILIKQVEQHRDHPALLLWVLGNEVNYLHHDDIDYWKATERMVQALHHIDPAHPVMVCVNLMPLNYRFAARYAPSLDILGLNVFQEISQTWDDLASKEAWQGPLVFSEWCPRGYWEGDRTPWSAPLEDNDQMKAARYEAYYREHILNDHPRCLGALVFYWGQKQERTHTWFSLFSEQGEPTPIVDAMERVWKGVDSLSQHAPMANSIMLNDQINPGSMYVSPSEWMTAEVFPEDRDGDSLLISWELMEEGNYQDLTGGDAEKRPPTIDLPMETVGRKVRFRVPNVVGPYRLFVYVRDGTGRMGYHNVPFFVVHRSLQPS